MISHYFYETISKLRINEEIILYDKVIEFNPFDEKLVQDFLQIEYETESFNYPFSPPKFDEEAALWAAKIVYTSCQILLYREHKETELVNLLPLYSNKITSENILSVDLCLRFLPQILNEAKIIDSEDALIPILYKILTEWHYSAIGVDLVLDDINLTLIFNNPCLEQMYIDRVIEKKDHQIAKIPQLNEKIKAVLGNYAEIYWKN